MSVAINHIDCELPNDPEEVTEDGQVFAGCKLHLCFSPFQLLKTCRLEVEDPVFAFSIHTHHGCPPFCQSADL
jgi:hypothetical protein